MDVAFANSAEFGALHHGATAMTPANVVLVADFYQTIFQEQPEFNGLKYWVNSGLNALHLLRAFETSQEFTGNQTYTNEITDFVNLIGVTYNDPFPAPIS